MRKWLRRACLGSAGLLALLSAVGPALAGTSGDMEAGRPESFKGYAYATAVQATLNTDPPQAIPEIVRLDLPYGESEFGSGSLSEGHASSLYTGSLGKFGTLACTLDSGACQLPAQPPNNVDAQYPGTQDAKAPASGPAWDGTLVGGALGQARAHAGRDNVSTFANGADLYLIDVGSAIGALPGAGEHTKLVQVGKARATTRHDVDAKGVLVSTASSILSDVSLFGGAIHIETITSTVTSRANGADVFETVPKTTITGVTVGGQPARITQDGLEMAGQDVSQGTLVALAGGLGEVFTNGDFDVRVIGARDESNRDGTAGTAAGLLLHWKIDGSGFPNGTAPVGDLILGRATTKAFAAQEEGFVPEPPDVFDPGCALTTGCTTTGGGDTFGPGVLDGTISNPGGSFGGATTETGGVGSTGGPALSGPGAVSGRSGASRLLFELLGAAESQRVQLLYGAFALAVLGLAVGSRLPGARLRPAPVGERGMGNRRST